MQQYKKHIAAFLLVGFLFPQVTSSIHYYVEPHGNSTQDNFVFTQTNKDLRFHSCLFHLNGFSTLLPLGNFEEIALVQISKATAKFYSFENYVHQPDFHFQLRGPPELLSYKNYTSALPGDKI